MKKTNVTIVLALNTQDELGEGFYMDINVDERKEKILEMLHNEGKVKVNELSQLFNVSEVTIRIDLSDLEEKGLLSRVHGGAVSSYRTYYNMNLNQRSSTNEAEKKAIVEYIASMVSDNETIMMNSGTTTLFALRALMMRKNLNIVTNSIAIALEAAGCSNFNVILLGGAVNTKYQFTFGDDALSQLSTYHADKLILSVDGVSCEDGFTTYYQQEAEICRQMLKLANTSIVAADFTKIGRTTFTKIASVSSVDHIITNDKAPKSEIENLKSEDINIILV